jgi:hypothetical protein
MNEVENRNGRAAKNETNAERTERRVLTGLKVG